MRMARSRGVGQCPFGHDKRSDLLRERTRERLCRSSGCQKGAVRGWAKGFCKAHAVKRGLQKPKAKVKKMKSETDPKVKKVEKRSEKAVKNVKKVKKKKDKMVKKVTVEPKDRMVRDTGGGETQSEKGGEEVIRSLKINTYTLIQ